MPSLIKDSTITFITRGLVFVIALGSSIVIARVLGPSLKGSYNLLMLIINVASMFVLVGLGSANVFYGARDPDKELPVLTGNSLVAALGLGAMGIIGVELITFLPVFQKYLTDNGIRVLWVRGLALSLPLALANAYLIEIVRARGDIARYNLVAIWNVFTSFVGIVVLVWFLDQGLPGAIYAWAISVALVFGLTVWLALRAAGSRPRFEGATLRRSFSFGMRLYPGNIAQFLNYRLDRFLVALFLTPAEVGLYATAAALSERLWEIPHSIRTVLLQRVAATSDEKTASATTARVSRVVVVLVGGMCLVVVLLSHFIILLLYGADYLPAAPALIALMPGTWTLSVGKLLAIHLSGSGRPEVGTMGALASLASTVALDLLLIPRFGIVGASVASSVSYTLSTVVILIVFLRVTGLGVADVVVLHRADVLVLRQVFTKALRRRIRIVRA
jgi:O-antigen/teichoic acid export membrane protein